MRTQEEIIARIKEVRGKDLFGFETENYFHALTHENLISLPDGMVIKENVPDDWEPVIKADEDLRKAATDYMPFAWGKANECRGLSAGRSLAHYKAWLWLLGEDRFEGIEDYQFYGKDELCEICKYLGLDSDQWDDGRRSNSEY